VTVSGQVGRGRTGVVVRQWQRWNGDWLALGLLVVDPLYWVRRRWTMLDKGTDEVVLVTVHYSGVARSGVAR
jgi:hypothetical protein